ncbi:MAG TPA: flagellar assembly protein FliH [Gammaproteobacteria bacterium]|nr:flagellar assembly protein FliH [Gammaproteobacteria bacterium]
MGSKLIDKAKADEGYQRWELPQVAELPATDIEEVSPSSLLTAEQLENIQAQAYKEAWDEGFIKGREKGLAAGRAEIVQRAALLDGLAQALGQPFEALDAAVEQALVDLAVTLAQALVRRELRSDPGQVVAVVREALAALPVASRHVRVCLHPDDVAVVGEALVARDAGGDARRDWHLQEDPTLMRGDCRILSENSQIDATMEKRLAAVVAQLSGGEREQDVAVDTSADGATTDATAL